MKCTVRSILQKTTTTKVMTTDTAKKQWSRAWSALRHRDFRILWSGTLVSNAGSWMQKVATAWLIYQITGSEAWLGVDAFASGIPTVLLLPWGGALSDRVSRRTLLIWTNLISALTAFALAALQTFHVLQIWHIISFSVVNGVVQAAMVPASTALLPALVGEDDLSNAIALNSMQFNLSRVIGPAVGGVTIVYLGAAWSFAINAVSFLVLVGAFILIRKIPQVTVLREGVGQSLKSGLGFLRGRADVVILLLMVFLAAFLGAPVVSMLPALVKSAFHREASSYSLLLTAFGVGAVAAAFLIAAFDHGKASRVWNFALLVALGLAQGAVGYAGPFSIATFFAAAAGLCFVGAMIRLGTSILQATPDLFRGRVSSFQQVAFRSGQPLGALTAGIAARHLGLRSTFGIFSVVLIACVLVLFIRESRHRQAKD